VSLPLLMDRCAARQGTERQYNVRQYWVLAGQRKPALVTAFKLMGYNYSGGNGEFHTRGTAQNLTGEPYLDVGTWSHSVTAIFLVHRRWIQGVLVDPGGS
jgi:hypothetical protein